MREAVDKAVADRIDRNREHHRDGAGGLQHRRGGGAAAGNYDLGIFRNHLSDLLADFGRVRPDAANQQLQIASFAPSKAAQCVDDCGDTRFILEIIRSTLGEEDADAADGISLLGTRDPRESERAAECRDELSSSHVAPPRRDLARPPAGTWFDSLTAKERAGTGNGTESSFAARCPLRVIFGSQRSF